MNDNGTFEITNNDGTNKNWGTPISRQNAENLLHGGEKIVLPLPPQRQDRENGDSRFEMEVYARFMRHLRHVPNSRMDIKIFSAIQFTADMMDHGDALVAKTLVDLGLRAPRKAFPVAFLDFADKSLERHAWHAGSAQPAFLALNEHWKETGDNRFAGSTRMHFAVYNLNTYVRA